MNKRVVLLSNHSLLASGVQQLLQGIDGLELSVVTAADREVVPVLKKLAPDVIVLDTGDTSLGEGVISRMLAEHPKARVIALNLNRSGIEVYRVRRVLQTDLDGFLEAIRGRAIPAGERLLPREDDPRDRGDGGGTIGT